MLGVKFCEYQISRLCYLYFQIPYGFFSPLALLIMEEMISKYRLIFVGLPISFLVLSILLHAFESLLLDACIFKVVISS